jgi:hypothetical protein
MQLGRVRVQGSRVRVQGMSLCLSAISTHHRRWLDSAFNSFHLLSCNVTCLAEGRLA